MRTRSPDGRGLSSRAVLLIAAVFLVGLTLASTIPALAQEPVGGADVLDAVIGTGTPASCSGDDAANALDAAVAAGGNITFDCGAAPHTIIVNTMVVDGNTTVDGGGLITLSGEGSRQIFFVNAGATLELSYIKLASAKAFGPGGAIYNAGTVTIANSMISDSTAEGSGIGAYGGAIANVGNGVLTIDASTLQSNTAGDGGGALGILGGTVTLRTSTFNGNYGMGPGGAIYIEGGTLVVENSTFSANVSDSMGGALHDSITSLAGSVDFNFATFYLNSSSGGGNISTQEVAVSPVTIRNSILYASTGNQINCLLGTDGSIVSGGFNVANDDSCGFANTGDVQNVDPQLGSLVDNVGPTLTHMIAPASPARDRVPEGLCLPSDQRGLTRATGAPCDSGAVSFDATTLDPSALACGAAFIADADATLLESAPQTNYGSDSELIVAGGAGNQAIALLRFDLAGLPAEIALSSAELELPVVSDGGAPGMSVEVQEVTSAWDESTVTWESDPGGGYTYDAQTAAVNAGVARIDVTPLVARWLSGGAPSHGLLILPAAGDDEELRTTTSEASVDRPRLIVRCTARYGGNPPDRSATDAAQMAAIEVLRTASQTPLEFSLGIQGGVQKATFQIPIPQSIGPDGYERSQWFLDEYAAALRLSDADAQLQLIQRDDSNRNLRYRQILDGIPVEGAELVVHLAGNFVVGLTGAYLPDLVPLGSPSLSARVASEIARAEAGVDAVASGEPQLRYVAQVAYAPQGNPRVTLAWLVSVAGKSSDYYLVDANNGAILASLPQQTTVFDLALRRAFTAGPTTNCASPLNTGTTWYTEDGRVQGAAFHAETDAAFLALRNTYNYMRNTTGIRRDGVDGNGGLLWAYTGVGNPWANAQYWCGQIEFGAGFVSQDIAAHEIGHGIMDATVYPQYQRESGALNESLSDIFGYATDQEDWTIGEDITGGAVRNMEFPAQFGHPDTYAGFVSFPATTTCGTAAPNNNDNCNVHSNSGIHNKAAQLLMEGGNFNGYSLTAMGRNRTIALYYNVLRLNQVTTMATFQNMRDGMLGLMALSRLNLIDFGLGYVYSTADECRVRNAYAAVGVGNGDSDCDGTENPGENGLWDDRDNDGIQNQLDRCPDLRSPNNNDTDADGRGDECDPDDDNDRICDDNGPLNAQPGAPNGCQRGAGTAGSNVFDNCQWVSNVGQVDSDDDNFGDVCDNDVDNDGRVNGVDNCPTVTQGLVAGDWNDFDGDGFGDVCDVDADADGICNSGNGIPAGTQPSAPGGCAASPIRNASNVPIDICVLAPNPGQEDTTEVGVGGTADKVGDACDLCPTVSSFDNADTDGDGVGNPCDKDDDNDHICDLGGPFAPGADGVVADPTQPQVGCTAGPVRVQAPIVAGDNCILIANRDQRDDDKNGFGYACDAAEQLAWRSQLGNIIKRYRLIPQWGSQRFPIPICPQCGEVLPFNYVSVINVVIPQGYSAQVVDNFGKVQTKVAGVSGLQSLNFRPVANASLQTAAVLSAESSEAGQLQYALASADETAYYLEFVPDAVGAPTTPVEATIGVTSFVDDRVYLPAVIRR